MISIIVPIFNAQSYLDRCITSILNQTYHNLELILVDDGSTDHSLDICKDYASQDSRIIVISKTNEGVGVARNEGLKIAKGDYIGFIDSDDYICANMYEVMYKSAVENSADIVQCGHARVSTNGEIITTSSYRNDVIDSPAKAFKEYCIRKNTDNYSWSKLYRRTIIENVWFGNYHYSEDAYFIIQCFLKCKKMVVISDPLYNYVQTPGSACRRPYNLHYEDTIKVGEFMYNLTVKTYPELAFYFARYTAIWIRYNYLERYSLGVSQDILHDYITKYKEYYSLSKVGIPNSIEKFLLLLFRISPRLYRLLKS